MLAACARELEAGVDAVAMVAAVADLIPAEPATNKVPKERVLESFASMQWRSEVDILASLTARHRDVRFLGFGAQTLADDLRPEAAHAELLALGAEKLARKRCDALFVNRVGVPGLGFASSTNAGLLLIARAGQAPECIDAGPPQPKLALAEWMLEQLRTRWWPEVSA
jgi:phosphopantothenoylcysteine decarboxylase/phosphopantothenate--cysteine ligase